MGMMQRVKHIHCVGIGGVGMSGIAVVLHRLGFQVSGSDMRQSVVTDKLVASGISVYFGHDKNNITNADVMVVSSAIDAGNPEIKAALAAHVPVVSRAQMLAELMRFKQGIAVVGTHGKTTTTSLLASIFEAATLDPTYVIGGKLNSIGENATLGEGPHFIAEADESDASFLLLSPLMAIVTNIDQDHMGTYDNDINKLHRAFVNFLHRLPFYGLAVLCLDDEGCRHILSEVTCPYVTYGQHLEADVRMIAFEQHGRLAHITIDAPRYQLNKQSLILNALGRHNALNALSAIVVALECGIDWQTIENALAEFAGIGRRCQYYGAVTLAGKPVQLLDDYGHHPCEVAATYEAIKEAYPGKRVVLVYQPHRYSRTEQLFEDFVNVLSSVDALVLTEVYAAGESPIPGADSRALCKAIRQRDGVAPVYAKDLSAAYQQLLQVLIPGDVILTQGAGNIGQFFNAYVLTEDAQGLREVG